MYAYARGNRSSRGIERECREDVVYRVITANRVPDHSTIAEFRKRHESALAELFGEVLDLCRAAGLVSVGVIAVDGTKVHANASNMANRDYRQIALEILREADRVDAEEDEVYGDARGDELPEQLRTPEGRPRRSRKPRSGFAANASNPRAPVMSPTIRARWRWSLIRGRSSLGTRAVRGGCVMPSASSMIIASRPRARCHALAWAGCSPPSSGWVRIWRWSVRRTRPMRRIGRGG
jgi:hypothetical protein